MSNNFHLECQFISFIPLPAFTVFIHLTLTFITNLLGQEIASIITEMSPTDVVLKFEKVYLPCVLLSKKR